MQMQKKRAIAVSTTLKEDVLLVRRMTVREELGRLYDCRLEVYSEDEDVKFEDLLGKIMSVRLELPDDKERFFTGYAAQVSQVGRIGRHAAYHATLRPWLWFLTRTADCRIFQEKSAPDIIKEIFRVQSRKGVAILMSTHTLEVAQEMCDRISIIQGGRIIARGTVDELRELAGHDDAHLTPVFLKLTGGTGFQEIDV